MKFDNSNDDGMFLHFKFKPSRTIHVKFNLPNADQITKQWIYALKALSILYLRAIDIEAKMLE